MNTIASGYAVNDIHSRMNQTQVREVLEVRSEREIIAAVQDTARSRQQICVAGGRHAMGGQQFRANGILIDTRSFHNVVEFDRDAGTITAEAGITWPRLIEYLKLHQQGCVQPWTIIQKQTGCNDMTLGGSISANVHGRGLQLKPLVGDIIQTDVVLPDGCLVRCSRAENSELFQYVAGGYGLFGTITRAKLRLSQLQVLRRNVRIVTADKLDRAFSERIDAGATYGDFQFAIDDRSDEFLHKGILSTYSPEPDGARVPAGKLLLTADQWRDLLWLAHENKSRAFEIYTDHYMRTNGQCYRSDDFQLATYFPNYHKAIDDRDGGKHEGTEVISELNVPRASLAEFLQAAAKVLRKHKAAVIYGTIRLIKRDVETALPWAKDDFACTVLNLHTRHDAESVRRLSACLRELIDTALALQGTFYLTYHRFATRRQVLTAYPEMPDFIAMKQLIDPHELFTSDWYCHHKQLLALC